LQHSAAKSACKSKEVIAKFPSDIQDFANVFYSLQLKRHKADYDPYFRTTKSDVLQDIESAREAIQKLERTSAKSKRAFSIWVILPPMRKE
jgi:hypothetical protein